MRNEISVTILLVLIAGLVVGVLLRSRAAVAADENAAAETILSLVALLPEPAQLSEEGVRARLEEALDLKFGNQPDDENIVKEFKPGFIGVQIAGKRFGVMSISKRYADNPPDMENADARLQLAMKNHTAWIAVDAVDDVPAEEKDETYRWIGRILAAVLEDPQVVQDGRGALAIYSTERGQMMYFHPHTLNLLRSEDPLAAVNMVDAPVVAVEADDPRMAAAVAEARRRWPEFTKAFENRTPGQAFSVKGPITEDDVTEFMWLEVTSIDEEAIAGKLANNPANMKKLKLNDPVELKVGDVNDWIYTDNDGVVGGFTVRAITEIQKERAKEAE